MGQAYFLRSFPQHLGPLRDSAQLDASVEDLLVVLSHDSANVLQILLQLVDVLGGLRVSVLLPLSVDRFLYELRVSREISSEPDLPNLRKA